MNHDTHIGFPTEQELIQYHEGKLDRTRVREIEELALDHPMLMEALEGYAVLATPGTSSGESSVGHSGMWKFWLGGAVVLGVAASVFLLNNAASKQENSVQKMAEPAKEILFAEPVDTSGQVLAEVRQLPEQEKVIIQKQEPRVFIDILDPVGYEEPISPIDTHSYPRIVNKDVTLRNDNLEYKSAGEVEIKRHAGIIYMGKILFIRNFKIIDYTLMRRSDWATLEPEGGVEAQFEDEDKQRESKRQQDKTEQTVGYIEFMDEAMAFVEKQQWKQAIPRFEMVLAQYPDDVNALFYGGYCAYQNEDFVLAETWLARSLESPIGTFREENKYHLAKVYMARYKLEEARTLLREIVAAKGFYTVQAQSLLEQL